MPKSNTERSKERRKRIKAKGNVLLTVEVHKSNVKRLKAIVDKINKGDSE